MRQHGKCMWTMIVCVASAFSFTVAGIYPNHAMIAELDRDIRDLKKKIETQRIIAPIYKELLKRNNLSELDGLAFASEVIPAKPKDIDQLSRLLTEIANQNEMVLKQITPDPEAYLKETAFIGIDLSLQGDFFHFRQLLIRLCRIAFLKEIESIRIYIENQYFIYNIRLIIAQEQAIKQKSRP